MCVICICRHGWGINSLLPNPIIYFVQHQRALSSSSQYIYLQEALCLCLCPWITIAKSLTLALNQPTCLVLPLEPVIQTRHLFSCLGYLCSFAILASSRGRLFSTYWIFFPLGSALLAVPSLSHHNFIRCSTVPQSYNRYRQSGWWVYIRKQRLPRAPAT